MLSSRPLGRLVLGPITRRGYRQYRRTGATPRSAYSAMRKLYAADPASFERLVSESQHEQPAVEELDGSNGVAAGEIESLVERLRRDGFAVLAQRLSEAACAELELLGRATECALTGAAEGAPAQSRFDPANALAVRYDLGESDIVRSTPVQGLLADESLLALAQAYLGATPMQDMVAMWWSVAAGNDASSAAAQLFHVDLDRLRFLKVFVYVTDVDDETGPHSFVRGSHRDSPKHFRADRRYSDTEVGAAFDGSVASIIGPRGTIFCADTRGLHKGQPLRRGHRLVFQMEYTTSLFGQAVRRLQLDDPIPELRSMLARFPSTFQRFSLSDRGPG